MNISTHQPQYIPWIPYFTKIRRSDVFVWLDDVQFLERSVQSRNFVLGSNGSVRLTIPVTCERGEIISNVLIAEPNILSKHWKTIEQNYKKAACFSEVSQFLKPIYEKQYTHLVEINNDIVLSILNYLNITTTIVKSSQLEKTGKKSDLMLSISKGLNATNYMTGAGGLEYMNKEDFTNAGITIELLHYTFNPYRQINNNNVFVPELSILDLLFNEGKNSINFI